MENDYNSNMGEGQEKKGRLADLSPEEARQKAKESVAKGMALGTGAIEGYVQNSDPKVVGDATRAAAKTASNTVKAVRDEVSQGLPGEPVFHRKSDAASGMDLSADSSGGFGDKAGEIKESLAERATHAKDRLKESASMKTQEFKERSRESFRHVREEMKEHTPDEIREKARDSVGRVVARGTGALEGVAESAQPDLPAQAVKRVGETVREAGGAIREEVKNARSDVKTDLKGGEDASLDDSTSGSGGI